MQMQANFSIITGMAEEACTDERECIMYDNLIVTMISQYAFQTVLYFTLIAKE